MTQVQDTIKAWYDRLHFPAEMDEAFLQALRPDQGEKA